MLDLELATNQNAFHKKSKHLLDNYQSDPTGILDGPESEPELEVYVDRRLYHGKVSWNVTSDTNTDYVLLPVTLEARGGSSNGRGGSGGGGGEPTYTPNPYISGNGNYSDLFFISDFNIQLEFLGSGWTPELYGYAVSMAELYSYLITGDEANVTIEVASGRGKNRTTTTYDIDDIYVTLTIESIDGQGGTLGYAGPEYARVVNGNYDTIIKGGLTLDSDDLATINPDLIDDIIFHEIGHIIGFGTMFSYQDLVTGNEYTGLEANNAYEAAYGTTTPLLLEDGGGPGTAGGHWEEDTGALEGNEIMTGYIDPQNWLSTVTIASYEDIGYETIWGETLTTDSSIEFLADITPYWGTALAQNSLA